MLTPPSPNTSPSPRGPCRALGLAASLLALALGATACGSGTTPSDAGPTSDVLGTTTDAASGTAEPTPSGTIVFDTRAGGAQSWQAVSDIAAVRSQFVATGGELTDGLGVWAFVMDYDGNGKHAVRVDWPANPGAESTALGLIYYNASFDRIYTSVVIHLGRTATGGGLGAVGSFVPVTTGGGMKRLLWLRNRDDGLGRIYWNWPTNPPAELVNDLTIDDLNYDDYFNADFGVGTDVRWTFELIAGNPGSMRVWRNGTLAHENAAAEITTLPFSELELMATRFNTTQDETEYWTDLVVWSP